MRLFIALSIPEDIEDALWPLTDGVPGAIWTAPGDTHLTLRFLGEIPDNRVADLQRALHTVRNPQFQLQLKGVGFFPPRGQPHSLWAGVADRTALDHLHAKIERCVTQLGLPADTRHFAPHVTLARLHHSPPHRVAEWLGGHALAHSAPWTVKAFALYQSRPGPAGSDYTVLQRYGLGERWVPWENP